MKFFYRTVRRWKANFCQITIAANGFMTHPIVVDFPAISSIVIDRELDRIDESCVGE